MRVFVAVWPPGEVVEALAALNRPHLEGVKWTTPEQWHVTLRFIGETDEPWAVVQRLAGVGAPATASLGPRTMTLSRRFLCLPVGGLDQLAADVRAATVSIGRPDARPWRGHLTLARARRGVPHVDPIALDVSWPVSEVTVVHSELGGPAARYSVLSRIALR